MTLQKKGDHVKVSFPELYLCEQTHQPTTMVVQNGCLICLPHRQQLMSSLSVSLTTNRCLTNETEITKTTIYQSNNRCQSISDQSGWVGSCCSIFSEELLASVKGPDILNTSAVVQVQLLSEEVKLFLSILLCKGQCTFRVSCQN